MTCRAIVPAKWHTPEHPCMFAAVSDGLCTKHLRVPGRLRLKIARLEHDQRQLQEALGLALKSTAKELDQARARLAALTVNQ